MFCPQCSQQQVSREVRFCSRCGFPLDGVAQLLASGGVPPAALAGAQEWEYGPPSPRLKGVRQGVILWMVALVLLPLMIVLTEEFKVPEAVAMLTTMLLVMGGFVRIVYAMMFEDGPLRRKKRPVLSGQAAAAQLQESWAQQQRDRASLPPGQSIPAGLYAPPRADTSEIAGPPPSVTENTTRLLKDEQQERG